MVFSNKKLIMVILLSLLFSQCALASNNEKYYSICDVFNKSFNGKNVKLEFFYRYVTNHGYLISDKNCIEKKIFFNWYKPLWHSKKYKINYDGFNKYTSKSWTDCLSIKAYGRVVYNVKKNIFVVYGMDSIKSLGTDNYDYCN